ncbi:MAG TPA: hypothetical protein VM492_01920 [Sumerlaeia bacterium]|nr:hypothetical protein [Sumerlaeia bacterium]
MLNAHCVRYAIVGGFAVAHLVVEDSAEGPLCFIGLQQLIANKKAANRPRDLADLEDL